MVFSKDVLAIDAEAAIGGITSKIREYVYRVLRRRGAVIGVSGGIDSSVCAALCVRALGKENVLIVLMPERDSSPESLQLGKKLAERFDTPMVVEDITPILQSAGCYRRQVEAIRMVFPGYGEGWKCKIQIPSILEGDRLNLSRLTIEAPSGEKQTARLTFTSYLQLVAATNFKQRTRTMIEYYHADRLNYAVCGTPNRLEYDQGFFVKGGDGLADFKPIAHLYKTQVYAIGRTLGVPEEICERTPTTDTFSLAQTQEEFFFAIPYEAMDLCLYGHDRRVPAAEVARVVDLTPGQVERVYKDIETKRRTTLPLHLSSLLITPVLEISEMMKDFTGG